ncbi:hypothetical protein LZ32DRAFT_128339 [Colletotrichum eremochloae]|nr:hypothetical protein LZ32DRAFT_128339 [Colletotrichum eremochloae]
MSLPPQPWMLTLFWHLKASQRIRRHASRMKIPRCNGRQSLPPLVGETDMHVSLQGKLRKDLSRTKKRKGKSYEYNNQSQRSPSGITPAFADPTPLPFPSHQHPTFALPCLTLGPPSFSSSEPDQGRFPA